MIAADLKDRLKCSLGDGSLVGGAPCCCRGKRHHPVTQAQDQRHYHLGGVRGEGGGVELIH